MTQVEIAVTRLPHNADLPLPAYETAQSAGMDLAAAIEEPITLAPGSRVMVPTGLAIALPEFEAPTDADIEVSLDATDVDDAVDLVIDVLRTKGVLLGT